MAWSLELSELAKRDLGKLDSQTARRILKFLQERLARTEDPRSFGAALNGPRFGELWKYRVGDYRILAKIEDTRVIVLVLRIGHRREIYR
jgi:mRNA interferase RelE/StbE